MADVTGPISSLPGSTHHDLPDDAMCDDHPDRPAVVRLQGETDSFGSEMHDLCKECLDAYREEVKISRSEIARCDWCHQDKAGLVPTRDYEEGMNGPVYEVCRDCRKRADDRALAELGIYGDDD
jgi:hypothetical protein